MNTFGVGEAHRWVSSIADGSFRSLSPCSLPGYRSRYSFTAITVSYRRAFLKIEEVGTAETSVHGIVLYRGAGTDHIGMYREAVWYYEAALLAEWGAAVTVGIGVYMLVRWLQTRVGACPDGPSQTPN